jgi:exonuclease 3'-5' domain-containing protein 1
MGPRQRYVWVDTKDLITKFLKTMATVPSGKLEISVDLEGNNLCRYGTISIVQVFVPEVVKVFLVDVTVLKEAAFETTIDTPITDIEDRTIKPYPATTTPQSVITSTDGPPCTLVSLKAILESPYIPTIFYDCRNDSNALYFLFGVSLACVEDVQLMENIHWDDYDDTKSKLKNIDHCMRLHGGLDAEAQQEFSDLKNFVKAWAKREGYGIFDQRPIDERLKDYAAGDAMYLPRARDNLRAKLDDNQLRMAQIEAMDRVEESQSESYNPRGPGKSDAPGWSYWRKSTRLELYLCAFIGLYAVCGHDCKRCWEQTHVCKSYCDCYGVCEQRRLKLAKEWHLWSPEEQDRWLFIIRDAEIIFTRSRYYNYGKSCVAKLYCNRQLISLDNEVEKLKAQEAEQAQREAEWKQQSRAFEAWVDHKASGGTDTWEVYWEQWKSWKAWQLRRADGMAALTLKWDEDQAASDQEEALAAQAEVERLQEIQHLEHHQLGLLLIASVFLVFQLWGPLFIALSLAFLLRKYLERWYYEKEDEMADEMPYTADYDDDYNWYNDEEEQYYGGEEYCENDYEDDYGYGSEYYYGPEYWDDSYSEGRWLLEEYYYDEEDSEDYCWDVRWLFEDDDSTVIDESEHEISDQQISTEQDNAWIFPEKEDKEEDRDEDKEEGQDGRVAWADEWHLKPSWIESEDQEDDCGGGGVWDEQTHSYVRRRAW